MNSRARGQFSGLRPAEPGNSLAATHGAHASDLKLAVDPRTKELAEQIRAVIADYYQPAFETSIELLAIVLRRVERAVVAIERVDSTLAQNPVSAYGIAAPMLPTLRADLSRWVTQAAKLSDALGLSPRSRAALGLDLARTRRSLSLIEYYEQEEAEG